MARALGVNKSSITNWYAGATPFPRSQRNLAELFKCTTEELFTLTDVEQVAGMLPIQRCDDLAGEESLEGDNVHLGLAEGLFDRLAPLHDAARGPVTSAPAMRTLDASIRFHQR